MYSCDVFQFSFVCNEIRLQTNELACHHNISDIVISESVFMPQVCTHMNMDIEWVLMAEMCKGYRMYKLSQNALTL